MAKQVTEYPLSFYHFYTSAFLQTTWVEQRDKIDATHFARIIHRNEKQNSSEWEFERLFE